ncbi:AAA family ATPase [Pseudomonadota bacterium]
MHNLLVIKAPNGRFLSKEINSKCKKISDIDQFTHYHFSWEEYETLHDKLKDIFQREEVAVLLSGPTDYLLDQLEKNPDSTHRRLLRDREDAQATVQYRDGVEMSIDLDDYSLPGLQFDPANPELWVTAWAVKNDIDCDLTYQVTASQKPEPTDKARARIWFQLDKSLGYKDRKRLSIVIGGDPAVYTATQPNYTSPPRIKDADDPIKQRNGFIKGDRSTFKNAKFKLDNLQQWQSSVLKVIASKPGEPIDIGDVQSVLDEGQRFRQVLLPWTFSLANKLKNRDSVMAEILKVVNKIPKNKRREKDWDGDELKEDVVKNIWEMIDAALRKISEEEAAKEKQIELEERSGLFTVNEYIPTKWILKPYFQQDVLIVLAGKQGHGKSTFCSVLAAAVTTGREFGSIGKMPSGKVLWLTAEEKPDSEIYARVHLNGGDMSKIKFINPQKLDGQKTRLIDVNRDSEYLKRLLTQDDYTFFIVDTATSFQGDKDSSSNSEIRSQLLILTGLAIECGVTIIALVHVNKSSAGNFMDDIQGASAYSQVPRCCLGVVKEKGLDGNELFYMGIIKNNLVGTDNQTSRWKAKYKNMPGDTDNEFPVVTWLEPTSESVDDIRQRILEAKMEAKVAVRKITNETIGRAIINIIWQSDEKMLRREDAWFEIEVSMEIDKRRITKNKFNKLWKEMQARGFIIRADVCDDDDRKKSEHWFELASMIVDIKKKKTALMPQLFSSSVDAFGQERSDSRDAPEADDEEEDA